MDNAVIRKSEVIKYLGVFIDSKLTWSEHVTFICKKLLKFTSFFYKLRKTLPLSIMRMLYNSLVYPHILYGIECYANTYYVHIKRLHILNNRIIRIILKRPIRTNIDNLYRDIGVLPITKLHTFSILVFVFKCIRCTTSMPEIFRSYFTLNCQMHGYSTRDNSNKLSAVLYSKSIGQRCIRYKGVKAWNTLPLECRLKNSINMFKKSVYDWLLNS